MGEESRAIYSFAIADGAGAQTLRPRSFLFGEREATALAGAQVAV